MATDDEICVGGERCRSICQRTPGRCSRCAISNGMAVVRSSLPGYPQESLGGRYAARWDSSRSAAAHDDLPDGRQRTIYASGLRNLIGSLNEDSLCQRRERQASLEQRPIFVWLSPIGTTILRGGG